MSGWQPIDSAPKDGTAVLIAFEGEVSAGYFDDGCDDDGEPFEASGWFWFDKNETGPCEPILWQPYPAPPSASSFQ